MTLNLLIRTCIVVLALAGTTQARFGQEHPATIERIRDCNGGGPGTINGRLAALAGSAISTLLAAADPCAQQDKADEIIDFAKGNRLPQACVQAAGELARAERNVNPFVRANPCSDICARAPRNADLRGAVQAFDPACRLQEFLRANPQQQANLDNKRREGNGANNGNNGANNGANNGGGNIVGGNPGALPANNICTCKPEAAAPQQQQAAQKQAAPPGGNLQTFPGALGGVRAPAVTANGNMFQVQGNAAFNQLANALERSCAVQHNQCANAANASGNKNGFNVGACDRQQGECDRFQRR